MTYPDPQVREELERWVVIRLDVSEHDALARDHFGVSAIPTALAVDADGNVLDRIVGFVEPSAFRARVRASRQELDRSSR